MLNSIAILKSVEMENERKQHSRDSYPSLKLLV